MTTTPETLTLTRAEAHRKLLALGMPAERVVHVLDYPNELLNPTRPALTVAASEEAVAIVAAYQRHCKSKATTDPLDSVPAEERPRIEEARRESPIELLAREFDRAAHMQGRGLIDHDRGDCYRDAAKRMRAVDRPGLTEEQAQAMAGPLCREMFNRIGLAIGNKIGAPEWMVDMMTAALLRASRGEIGSVESDAPAPAPIDVLGPPLAMLTLTPAPTQFARADGAIVAARAEGRASLVAIEGLGPEPGILAPAASDAARPPVPAGHVSISRDVLSRLVDATLRDESVRGPREAAEHVLHLDLLRHEPARHDVGAARAAARANDPRPCPECHMSVAHKLGCSRRRGGQ